MEIGGHIHINKNAFWSIGHTYKFLRFLRTNIEYVEFIGERLLQQQWCKASSKDGRVVQLVKQSKRAENSDRYEMVNFTNQTIELRFFWSPPCPASLYKNAEFVDSLFHYTINSSLHFNVEEFEKYIEFNCSSYPYLYNYIISRKGNNSFSPNAELCKIQPNRISASPVECESALECNSCGEEINSDDICFVRGATYCRSCVEFCDYCETYHRTDTICVIDSSGREICVCENCLSSHFVFDEEDDTYHARS
jgi:hypothetical protein